MFTNPQIASVLRTILREPLDYGTWGLLGRLLSSGDKILKNMHLARDSRNGEGQVIR